VLAAGAAGDRPEGIAPGVAGHGGDAAGYSVTDRATTPSAPLSADGRAFHDRFVAAIDDDLDMPVALALLREILRSTIEPDERRWLVLDADAVLGLDLHRVWQTESGDVAIPDEVRSLVADREAARAAADYPAADGLRDRIDALGWEVIDTPAGSEVRPRA
jgi:cysteinyl-tRNA synthetase